MGSIGRGSVPGATWARCVGPPGDTEGDGIRDLICRSLCMTNSLPCFTSLSGSPVTGSAGGPSPASLRAVVQNLAVGLSPGDKPALRERRARS